MNTIKFIDIETVPGTNSLNLLSERSKKAWIKKASQLAREENISDEQADKLYSERAGIFSEFGKIIVISVGSFEKNNLGKVSFNTKSFFDENETDLLNNFNEYVKESSKQDISLKFCGHNIREFDIPYICRRMVINRVSLPECFQLWGKKPWEVRHLIDTMELWSFGDRKNFTSLDLLADIFGIESSKDNLDGSMVAEFFKQNRLKEIVKYCEKDVEVVAKIYIKFFGTGSIKN